MKRRMLMLAAVVLALFWGFTSVDRVEGHTRITTNVTWGEHIRPILREKCMTCHHPGGIAPDFVDFTFYGTDTEPGAWAWRASIEEMIITEQMPPWKADSRFGSFSNVRQLTEEEIREVLEICTPEKEAEEGTEEVESNSEEELIEGLETYIVEEQVSNL